MGDSFKEDCTEHKKKKFPSLIPPTWNKRIESSYMRRIWSAAFTEIQNATNIIFIGYSLPETDLYFRHFLTLALKDNRKLRNLVVVNNDDIAMKRYENFLESNFSAKYLQKISKKFNDAFLFDPQSRQLIMPS